MTIMKPPSRFLAASDLNIHHWPYRREASALGIPVLVEADRPNLIDLMSPLLQDSERPHREEPVLRVRLSAAPGALSGTDPRIEVKGTRLLITGEGVHGRADSMERTAECSVAKSQIRKSHELYASVFEPLLLFLLTRSGRTPIHAAAFAVGDCAILLAGPSGSGKSCLSLAALRAGYPILSDDMVFVQRNPVFRVWGLPHAIHLYPEDLNGQQPSRPRIRGGKLKHAVCLPAREPMSCGKAILCVLKQGDRAALDRISFQEALEALDCEEAGFDLLRDEVFAAIRLLARRGAWRLTLSERPDEAVDLLKRNGTRLGVCVLE